MEMRSGGLGIEQLIAALAQAIHEVDQSNFAGVAGVMEHAFAEKCTADADAIEAAGKLAVTPDFDTVGELQVVKTAVGGDHLVVNPGAAGALFHAGAHDA